MLMLCCSVLLSGCMNSSIAVIDQPIDVSIQDYYGEIQSYFLINVKQNTTLTTDAIDMTRTISVVDTTNCNIGEGVNVYDNESFFQSLIQSKTINSITFANEIDKAFSSTNTKIQCGAWNMNVNGAITPVVFSISPPTDINWHIKSTGFQCTDNSDWDSNTFCSRDVLSNGLIVRVVDGYTKNLFLIYNNGGFGLRGYDIIDYDKAPAGSFGFSGILNLPDNYGAFVQLVGKEGDTFEYVIQDDMTSQTTLASLIGGHATTE